MKKEQLIREMSTPDLIKQLQLIADFIELNGARLNEIRKELQTRNIK
jgi:hypothetical protein